MALQASVTIQLQVFSFFCRLHRGCMRRAQHASSETLYTALGTRSHSYRSIYTMSTVSLWSYHVSTQSHSKHAPGTTHATFAGVTASPMHKLCMRPCSSVLQIAHMGCRLRARRLGAACTQAAKHAQGCVPNGPHALAAALAAAARITCRCCGGCAGAM